MNRRDRTSALIAQLEKRILVLDGAMGTALQAKDLSASDFGGADLEGCNEHLVLTRPDLIADIHTTYLEAGADILETNSFGGTPLVLAEYGLEGKYEEINRKAAEIARRVADAYTHRTPAKPRFVAGSMGPTTKAISVTGGVSFDQLLEHFYKQARALYDGGVDYLLLETCQDTRNIKAGLVGIEQLFAERDETIPVAVSVTIEPMGTMLAGQAVDALVAALEHFPLLYIGLNCATGPEFMTDHIRSLSELAKTRVGCVPNAGLPDADGYYLETPEMLARVISRFIDNQWINLVGGCCGTTAAHIRALSGLAQDKIPRKLPAYRRSFLSGVDFFEVKDDERPVIVGERTNVIGSRKFKNLICAEKHEEASEIARAQVKSGAQVIDVCLANPDRDEFSDMTRFLDFAIKKVRVPLMIDSTDDKVIHEALKYCQGKAIINSINLEDGEERFQKVIPLAKRYGAAVIVGTIDDDPVQGMGVTRERKREIAERSYRLLTEKYGVWPEDIYWDSLVFPCATGDAQYVGSAVETIEGVRLVKAAFPGTKTILGISNVSFGLPAAGREVLNSVFLYHCVQAGLDLAIVNAEKLERYASIPEADRKLAEDLIWNRGEDPIGAFTAAFRENKAKVVEKSTLPLEKRLANYILEGSKDGLIPDLEVALKKYSPLDIINGPLMDGMNEVGRLFNANELIVAEVLQSAEAMKAAVAFLEPFMPKNESASRGKVVLATVKGDVHDIGKNLVTIIFSNNGFHVIDLGIKVPPEKLIQAVREHKPTMLGLSGLLVKSAQQMEVTAGDLSQAGIDLPVLVGGAALSREFTDRRIAKSYIGTVEYAPDAMSGLDLAKQIVNPEQFNDLKRRLKERRLALPKKQERRSEPQLRTEKRCAQVPILAQLPQAPDFTRHVLIWDRIELIWPYLNPLMLYAKHLGVKGAATKALFKMNPETAPEPEDLATAEKIHHVVEEVKASYAKSHFRPKAVYQFIPARGIGNSVILYTPDGKTERARFVFPRQIKEDGLCLADYLHPERMDNLAVFVVTAALRIREEAERLKEKGDYLHSHVIQALALESAEAYAEFLHAKIRRMWGLVDPPQMTMMACFQAKYPGKRYSFGYPACPNLDDQKILFDLLRPEEIGVELTEGCMMDPEASVSAIVFHHPSARYFSVGKEE